MSIRVVKRGRPSKADILARENAKPKVRSDSQILSDLKERFDILSLLTKGAIAKNIRAMVVTGAPGVGKTYTVENILEHSKCEHEIVRGPTVDSAETDEALAIVEASRATADQSAFDDESSKDAEVTTAMVDPALAMANTFNQAPGAMSLEFLGIIKPIEEKSDAEVRAEQVVAANKEQQDAINANYMDVHVLEELPDRNTERGAGGFGSTGL